MEDERFLSSAAPDPGGNFPERKEKEKEI